MERVIDQLKEAGVTGIKKNARLADYTTWRIGGPADLLIVPECREQLAAAVRILRENNIPWIQLGRGSNMLVSDKGIRGAVFKLGKAFEEIRFDGETAIAGGAASFVKLCILAGKEGLTGLEFAGGIPGSVGGAVYMNAGAHGSDVSRVLQSAEVVLETGEMAQWDVSELRFGYRHSRLQEERGIVTEAIFRLQYGDRKEIAAALATYKDRRRKTQPLNMACAGSVFRNPEGTYAAKLIEESGLKGLSHGGAQVSTLHANFIVNTGNATAQDVLALMERIQETVYRKYGIKLVPEVLLVGER
jgi:UDP-N-acetylmuramate dehydrogenase